MTYTKDSPIAAPSDVTGEELYKAFEPMTPAPQLANMRNAMYAVVGRSAATGIDPLVMAAVGWVETGYGPNGLPFRHPNWIDEFNFGNLGKTGDEAQDAAAQTWQTPADGAIAAVAHMVGYRYGEKWRTAWDVDELGDPRVIDDRFGLAVYNTPYSAGVKKIGELNNRWAVDRDNDYGGKLAIRANALKAAIDKQRAANGGTAPMATWQKQFDTMFGAGKWRVTQDWGNDPAGAVYDDMYSYGVGHGTNGQTHPGIDVGIPYGSPIYAPADATVICAGTNNGPGFHGQGCGAFGDWGDQCEDIDHTEGIGRVELQFDNGEALIFGHSRRSLVKPGDRVKRGQQIATSGGMCGAHSHLEARRWDGTTYQLFDPKLLLTKLSTTSAPVDPAGPEEPMAKPSVLLIAGHRNTSSGSAEEVKRTPMMAKAYRQAFRAAGYVCDWLEQDVDQDADPDDTVGGLDKVSRIAHDWIAAHPGECLLLDLHFEGTSASTRGMFTIAPNRTGLTTAAPFPQAPGDVWESNEGDRKFGGDLTKRITAATGLTVRGGLREPGVMDERATGVGGQGYRLATMAYTSEFYLRCIRLVVEHGNLPNAQDRAIIDSPGFADKCAAAAVATANAYYGVTPGPVDPPPPVVYATPEPPKQAGTFQSGSTLFVGACDAPHTITKTTTPRKYAEPNEKATGPDLVAGDVVNVSHVVMASDKQMWGLIKKTKGQTKDGSRIPMSAVTK